LNKCPKYLSKLLANSQYEFKLARNISKYRGHKGCKHF
jgi:hypothetical protein